MSRYPGDDPTPNPDFVREERLDTAFRFHAEQRAAAPCFTVAGETKSYGEVSERADAWAGAIAEVIGGPAARLGVCSARGAVGYTGLVSALYGGGAFVPLNPAFPPERTRAMVEIADLDAIVTEGAALESLLGALEGLANKPPVFVADGEGPASDGATSTHGFRVFGLDRLDRGSRGTPRATTRDDIAYILFTSGSTGVPKGVPIQHENILHNLRFNQDRYGVTPDDRYAQTSDFTFDRAIFDTFISWRGGGQVVPLRTLDQLSAPRFVAKWELTLWSSVPSVAALLRKARFLKPGSMPSLRWSLFGGEALPLASAEAWNIAAPNSTVENMYGPTELAVDVTVYPFDPDTSPAECLNGTLPIGKIYPGLRSVVLDEDDRPVEEGDAGLLCVAGPQTFPGYWRNEEKSREALFEREDSDGVRRRYYRTGDLVRALPSGNYLYLGRADSQVKILGTRVELGEVEGALRQAPGVVMAAAIAWPMVGFTAEGIVAYVSGEAPDAEAVLTFLRDRLPAFMVPREVRVLDEFPLNASGKIDRKVLRGWLAAESEA